MRRQQLFRDPSYKLQQNIGEIIEKFNDVELKFRSAKCMIEMHQFKEASNILQTIPLKLRPAKVSMLLTKTADSTNDKHLIANYREVLRKCPMAFECIDGLINLGVKGTDVNSLIINISSSDSFEWINHYIRGASEIQSRNYSEAIATLKSIDCLKNNSKIQAMIGEAFYFTGDYERSHQYLKRAYELNPFMKQGIQKFALVCEMYRKTRDLELMLRPTSAYPYDYSSENWFVMSLYCLSCLKYEKAQYFIERIFMQNQTKNVDALILNARVLHNLKKPNEALVSLRSALKYEPHRFEVHRWIIEILMNENKGRDAQSQAVKSLKHLGENPRSLTLAASTYLKNPICKEKAKMLLEKALSHNEYYAKAIFFLAQILINDKEHKAAIKLLEKSVQVVNNVKITVILADLYATTKNLSLANEYYTKVLNIDSSNRHALNGLRALGTTSEKALEVSSTTCGENDDSSADVESSRMKTNDDVDDSELVWSDVEMEAA